MSVERVQRKFTKALPGFKTLSYVSRLNKLGLLYYTTVSTYSTFNTSPTTINLLRIGGEYLTKSLEKQTKNPIFIS